MYYIVRSDIVYRLSFIVIEFPVYVSKISGQQDKDGRSDIIRIILFILIVISFCIYDIRPTGRQW